MKIDLDEILDVCRKTADLSDCKFRVSCVLVDRNGDVVATGHSHWSSGNKMGRRNVHAEFHALRKVAKPSSNLTMFLYRKSGVRHNKKYGNNIEPCPTCAKLIKSYGIRTVWCTTDDGWEKNTDGDFSKVN